jgi:hypothetical protein
VINTTIILHGIHAAHSGDSALFLLVILGIAAATVVAIIRGRRSR